MELLHKWAFPVGINPNIPFYAWPAGAPQAESCSMFLRAGILRFAQVQSYKNASGARVAVDVDLQPGTLANAGPIGSGLTYLGSSITAYSNGIYRVSLSGVIPDPHNLSCVPLTEDSLGNVIAAPDGTITAAQLADNSTYGNHLTNHSLGWAGLA